MLERLIACWPIFFLLYLPRLFGLVAALLARRTRATLDHRIPDDLPLTAGAWLEERLQALGYPITVIATDRTESAYLVRERVIRLSDAVHFKADPVYWATAAHELGHARIRFELPVIGRLRLWSLWLAGGLRSAGIALTFGRVLYAIPVAGDLAFGCFALALALHGFVLLDEAIASVLAHRELRASGAIHRTYLRAADRVLIAAFATYVVTYAAYGLLLVQWPLIEALARPAVPMELTLLGKIVIAACSIGCVVHIVSRLVAMFAPAEWIALLESRPRLALSSTVLHLSPVVLAWLAWDHRADAAYAWCSMLGFAGSAHVWLAIVHWPHVVPHGLATVLLVPTLSGPGPELTWRYMRAQREGAKLIDRGNRVLDELRASARRQPSWPHRLAALATLGYLPLLVVYWLT